MSDPQILFRNGNGVIRPFADTHLVSILPEEPYFNVIIFSAVTFAPEDSTWFLNSKPNLLNVAVSRAKHLFITCGNFQKLLGAGDYLQTLCERSRDFGYLLDGTPDDHVVELTGTEYLYTCDHISYLSETLQGADLTMRIDLFLKGP